MIHLSSKERDPSRTQLPKDVLYRQRCGTAAIWGNNKKDNFATCLQSSKQQYLPFSFFLSFFLSFSLKLNLLVKKKMQLFNGITELLHKDPLLCTVIIFLLLLQ